MRYLIYSSSQNLIGTSTETLSYFTDPCILTPTYLSPCYNADLFPICTPPATTTQTPPQSVNVSVLIIPTSTLASVVMVPQDSGMRNRWRSVSPSKYLFETHLRTLSSFSPCTPDCQSDSGSRHLQKFSDDSAVVGCIRSGQESEYRQLVDNFVDWCNQNHLLLNVNKTKEMVVDFRRTTVSTRPLKIMGEEVEVVEDYKYLGVHLNDRLDWSTNTNTVYKKGMSRLYFLRKLRSFNVCSKMLEIF